MEAPPRCDQNVNLWSSQVGRYIYVDVDCEVFNIFVGLILQQGLSRLEQGRKRQGLVPEYRLRVPARGEGVQVTELVLAEHP